MALSIPPRPGTVVICDYDLGHTIDVVGEMTKRRPVVVLSPRRRRGFGPVIVVPLSTVPPTRPDERHVRIAAGTYPFLRRDSDSWVKCEFVAAVSDARLDRLRPRDAHISPSLHDSDFQLILRATLHAIGAGALRTRE